VVRTELDLEAVPGAARPVSRDARVVDQQVQGPGPGVGELAHRVEVAQVHPPHFRAPGELRRCGPAPGGVPDGEDALAVTGYERLAQAGAETDDLSLPFAQRLGARARAYVQFAADNGPLLELMLSRKHTSLAAPELLGALERTTAPVQRMIADAQKRGELIQDDPRSITLSIGAALQGIAAFVANGTIRPERSSEALEALLRHLLQGLTPR
jgi:hypothetical protein